MIAITWAFRRALGNAVHNRLERCTLFGVNNHEYRPGTVPFACRRNYAVKIRGHCLREQAESNHSWRTRVLSYPLHHSLGGVRLH